MTVNVTQWQGEIGMFYIGLSPLIEVSTPFKNSTIFKFDFLHCLLMLKNNFIIKWLKCYLLEPYKDCYFSYKCVPSDFNVCSNTL